jgi:hypothetical protein
MDSPYPSIGSLVLFFVICIISVIIIVREVICLIINASRHRIDVMGTFTDIASVMWRRLRLFQLSNSSHNNKEWEIRKCSELKGDMT